MTRTNVMRLLDAAKIRYRTAEYAFDENDLSGLHAAEGIGMRVFRGEIAPEELPETALELDFNAYIPSQYIEDETQRIEIYHKIAAVEREEERMEIIDELIDRFGDIPKAVQNLILAAQIKTGAQRLGIEKVVEKQGSVSLIFLQENKLTPKMILNMVSQMGSKAVVNAGRKPFIKYKIGDNRRKAEEILALINSLIIV